MVWRVSPRWAKVKEVPQAKFKAAQAKAAKGGVENLTKDDIAGLNAAQIKELRGYKPRQATASNTPPENINRAANQRLRIIFLAMPSATVRSASGMNGLLLQPG